MQSNNKIFDSLIWFEFFMKIQKYKLWAIEIAISIDIEYFFNVEKNNKKYFIMLNTRFIVYKKNHVYCVMVNIAYFFHRLQPID